VIDGRLAVVDLGSGTTRVNGVDAREAFLTGGERLCLGDDVLSVHRSEQRHAESQRAPSFGQIHGESEAIRSLHPLFETLAETLAPALVEGEAGVGKQLFASELHRRAFGDRTNGVRFAERGAPSSRIADALFARGGLVDEARGGTLFLEEVRDLSLEDQEKLATVIEATSHEPLARRVRFVLASRGSSELAETLAHLVAETRVVLPPLRDRDGDVLLLARLFWAELGGGGSLPDDLAGRLADRAWPGNVRELRIAVQDRVLHGHESAREAEPAIDPGALQGDAFARVLESELPLVEARMQLVAEFERRYVHHALARSGQNVTRAARASGIAPRYFQVLRARYRTG
jgi:DNA-binding NtrC family response regulator